MIYVDDAFIPYRNMLMSHLIADSTDELLDFVDRIGVNRKWIQKSGLPDEHFDISKFKRTLAIELGAKPVSSEELVRIIRKKRDIRS